MTRKISFEFHGFPVVDFPNRPDGPSYMRVYKDNKIKEWSRDNKLIFRCDGPAKIEQTFHDRTTHWAVRRSSLIWDEEVVYAWSESRGIDVEDMTEEELLVFLTEFCE